ncbi:hypothetical protein FA15DRAFT_675807 [Coprinopsis marcescibilis]|uniref:Uncharacterized protein n=1 Tax=Coprinopsis marcescibilis TaxID=230819 RepID=A0A5C3KCH0_COPMA|nr:hypothetical protein FA15DRAFT_675807 [Coprinopsis marcescibilis]
MTAAEDQWYTWNRQMRHLFDDDVVGLSLSLSSRSNRLAPESGLASCGGGAAKIAVGLMGKGSVPYQSASTR